jgi:hypothetical protein
VRSLDEDGRLKHPKRLPSDDGSLNSPPKTNRLNAVGLRQTCQGVSSRPLVEIGLQCGGDLCSARDCPRRSRIVRPQRLRPPFHFPQCSVGLMSAFRSARSARWCSFRRYSHASPHVSRPELPQNLKVVVAFGERRCGRRRLMSIAPLRSWRRLTQRQ